MNEDENTKDKIEDSESKQYSRINNGYHFHFLPVVNFLFILMTFVFAACIAYYSWEKNSSTDDRFSKISEKLNLHSRYDDLIKKDRDLTNHSLSELEKKTNDYIDKSILSLNENFNKNIYNLQESIAETNHAFEGLEIYMKQENEKIINDVSTLKSNYLKNKKSTKEEGLLSPVSEGDKERIISFIYQIEDIIKSGKIELLKKLCSEDAEFYFNNDSDVLIFNEYASSFKNELKKWNARSYKIRAWYPSRFNKNGDFLVILEYGYSHSSEKSKEEGMLNFTIRLKNKGLNLKVEFMNAALKKE